MLLDMVCCLLSECVLQLHSTRDRKPCLFLPTKDTSDSEASLPSEETTPDPGTEVQEATAPPEASG